MFAFVIWDTETQTAFGARDWFGIKPLYLAETGDGFGFASEAKSLRALTGPAVVDTDALRHYLVLQYVPEPESADAHLRRIESGTSFTLRDGVLTAKRYFRPRFAPTKVNGPEAEAELYAQILEVLDDSVAKHMRADVTVGSFLSGGASTPPRSPRWPRSTTRTCWTFTTASNARATWRSTWQPSRQKRSASEHYVKTVSETELCETLPLIVWYLDDPVADPALVPLYFVAREARKHVKVVLSGEGADEPFGGYNRFTGTAEPASAHRAAQPAAQGSCGGQPGAAAGLPRQELAGARLDRSGAALLRQCRPQLPRIPVAGRAA